eukprot:symbB.v1.2.004216.t1/scaffold215.1/size331178/9
MTYRFKPTQCFLSQQLYRRAIEAADSCLKLDPDHVKALHRRSLAFEAIHSYAAALLDLETLRRRQHTEGKDQTAQLVTVWEMLK